MKTFIINFICVSIVAGIVWGLFVPSSLPANIKEAFMGVMAFTVTIFACALSYIDHLFDEFNNRGKK